MKPIDQDLRDLEQVAIEAATVAGNYIQSQFDQHHASRYKATGDTKAAQVVTEVDIEAQRLILEKLNPTLAEYDLGLLTEESADDGSRLIKSHFWSVDPMDGTLAFVEGRTGYSVTIALISKDGDPVLGVVYVPDFDRCYSAIKGSGVKLNGRSFNRPVSNGTFVWHMDKSLQGIANYNNVAKLLKDYVFELGFDELTIFDSYGAVRNIIGVLESADSVFFKFPKKSIGGGCIWDYAATRLFFEESYLSVSDSHGESLHLNNPETPYMNEVGVLYATNSRISEFILNIKE
ncbi:MAG: inositol monophosphatase [Ekhidna sp.]|nr:inositol monophosphatase [Ekhidna sp.]